MFRINGEQWFLELVPPTSHALMRSDGTYTVGLCDDNTKTIYINDELQGEFLKKVIRHEVVHASMFSYEVDLTLEQEEVLADLIATYGEEIIEVTNVLFNKITKRRERFK
jgi:hypothetical protein